MYDARALRLEVLEEFEEARRSAGLHDELSIERYHAYRLERARERARDLYAEQRERKRAQGRDRMRRVRELARAERTERAEVQRPERPAVNLPTPLVIVGEILASESSPTRDSSLRYAAESERAARAARAETAAPLPFKSHWTCPGCGRQLRTRNAAEWCCRESVSTL